MESIIWTIKVSKEIDRMVSDIVKLLGYTSKAEFVREAVRDAIIRKYIGLLGLYSMDKLSSIEGDPLKALEELSSLGIEEKIMREEIKIGRREIEKLIYY